MRVVPDEGVPAEVTRYLVPSETQTITVRRHPAVLTLPVSLLVADVTAFALVAADVIPGGAAPLAVLGILFPLSCYFLYRSVLAWWRTFLVITIRRILLINWQRKRRLITIPIMEADDISFVRTLPGQFVGYGSFQLNDSGLRRRLRKIKYLPYPEQLYLELCAMIFP
jgi:hypothetical protein